MTSFAARERTYLCATAQQHGPDAPTLCGAWTVKDLVVHLLVRESGPAAIGVVVPPLAGVTERASRRLAGEDFTALVNRLRNGPPLLSPFSLPKVDSVLNLLEFYVHHEDIRRAEPGWEPRYLRPEHEDAIWRALKVTGRGLVRNAAVGVVAERTDNRERRVLRSGEPSVVVRGLPSEIALFLFGRKDQALVELIGDDVDVAALRGADLSV